MSRLPFPEKIDVRKFFSRHADFSAGIPLSSFSRLGEYLRHNAGSDAAEIDMTLGHEVDENGRFLIRGKLSGLVQLTCQRCLQGVAYPLVSAFEVQVLEALTASGDRELTEDELDVVLAPDGQLELLNLLEDELILSLPLVVYHEAQDCNETLIALKKAAQQKPSPFAALEALKNQLHPKKEQ